MSLMSASAPKAADLAAAGLAALPPQAAKAVTVLNRDFRLHLPDLTDPVQAALQEGAFYDQALLTEVVTRLPEAPRVVDLGAEIGSYSLFFAAFAEAEVISVETDPALAAVLQANIDLNPRTTQIELHREGALDAILGARPVDLIRLHADTAEALEGADRVLERDAPLILVEAPTLDELRAVEGLLRAKGYRKICRSREAPSYLFQKPTPQDGGLTRGLLAEVAPHLPKTSGIYAGMASRTTHLADLRAAVMSLLPQVDGLFLTLFGTAEVPEFLTRFDKIRCRLAPEGAPYEAAARFWGLEQSEDAIYLACAEDTLYPVDYTERMVTELAHSEGRALICVEGSLLVQPLERYADKGSRSLLPKTQDLLRRRRVHLPDSGSVAFHTATLSLSGAEGGRAEVSLALAAEAQDLPRYVLPHRADWLTPLSAAQTSARATAEAPLPEAQDQALRAHLPLSLAASAQPCPVVVVALERDANIVSVLSSLRLEARDPVLLVVCDEITEKLKQIVSQHAARWEMHLVSRRAPLPAAYATLLATQPDSVTFLSVKNRQLQQDPAPAALQDWVQKSFPQVAS